MYDQLSLLFKEFNNITNGDEFVNIILAEFNAEFVLTEKHKVSKLK